MKALSFLDHSWFLSLHEVLFFDTRALKQIYGTAQRQLDTRMRAAG